MRQSVCKLFSASMIIGLLLSGCDDKKPAPVPETAPAPEASASSAPAQDGNASETEAFAVPEAGKIVRDQAAVAARITGIKLSESGDSERGTIGLPRTIFSPSDTIFAEIATEGTASDYTIYARWLSGDGMVLSEYGINVSDPGRQTRIISLSSPNGWSKGVMKLEVSINTQPIKAVEIKIQ